MKDHHLRTPRLAEIAAAIGLTALTLTGCAAPGEKTQRARTQQFNEKDFKYKILIEANGDRILSLYTNDPVDLGASGGQSIVRATNVYCPAHVNIKDRQQDSITDFDIMRLSNLGCEEFTSQFQAASPHRIIVTNP